MTTRPQAGTVSALVVSGAFMLLLGGLALADAGSFLYARARAQTAADSAALAAVVEQVDVLSHGEDPYQAAAAEAARNGAQLISCDCEPGETHATVEVRVRPRVALLAAWASRTVRARARAIVDPAVATYRRGNSGSLGACRSRENDCD